MLLSYCYRNCIQGNSCIPQISFPKLVEPKVLIKFLEWSTEYPRETFLTYSFLSAGCFSGDNDHFLAIHQRKSGKPVFIYHHVQSVEKSLDTDSYKNSKQNFHSSSHTKINKLHPAIIVKSTFPRPAYDPSLNLLAMAGQDLEVENLPIPATNVIVVVSAFFWFLELFCE